MSPLRGYTALLAGLICQSALAADSSGIQTFDANGVKISYAVDGKGEPVVLIHGWLASGGLGWDLPGITAALAKDYQVIRLDMPGHGLSDKPTKEEAYGLELVEDVIRLLDRLKIKKAHIVGYSMGGIITAKLVAKYPERVLSGTLCGMGWLRKEVAAFAFAGLAKDAKDAPGICFRSLAKLALSEEEIKSIRVPMTVLVGDNDGLVKKLYVEPLQQARKDWPVVEIKDGDHLSTILKPQFKEEIHKWLAKQGKR